MRRKQWDILAVHNDQGIKKLQVFATQNAKNVCEI